jgi:hypothetical protein
VRALASESKGLGGWRDGLREVSHQPARSITNISCVDNFR